MDIRSHPQQHINAFLNRAIPGMEPIRRRSRDCLPADKGAYLLVIYLSQKLTVNIGRKAFDLPAGAYLYAGSARGPGGIAARVNRHFRRHKAIHWHVDQLTNAAESLSALAFPGGSECALIDSLSQSGELTPPLPGFGSSDCRHCVSHVLGFPAHP